MGSISSLYNNLPSSEKIRVCTSSAPCPRKTEHTKSIIIDKFEDTESIKDKLISTLSHGLYLRIIIKIIADSKFIKEANIIKKVNFINRRNELLLELKKKDCKEDEYININVQSLLDLNL